MPRKRPHVLWVDLNYSASKSPAWPVLRLPLIASFCEGRHRGFEHRRVAVRVACPLCGGGGGGFGGLGVAASVVLAAASQPIAHCGFR
jgi:hypothetical protein